MARDGLTPAAANNRELIAWVGDNRRGHFEVDGVEREVPDSAELGDVRDRLLGRRIIEIGRFLDAYVIRTDDGQVVEICGVWCNDSTADTDVRFWTEKP